jgi:hypothetical protein
VVVLHDPEAALAETWGTHNVNLAGMVAGQGIVLDGATPGNLIPGTPPFINVKDPPYSAKGDGSTDDTAAIQSAIDAVAATVSNAAGGTVFFPKGTYMVSTASGSPLQIYANVRLLGQGKASVS